MTSKKTAAKKPTWVAKVRLTDGTKAYEEGQTVPGKVVDAHPWLIDAGYVAAKGAN